MFDYALVHLKYTVPLAGLLWQLGRPLRTKREQYRTKLLILIAVTATTPWDSYLIRRGVWSYPDSAVIGPTLFSIPAEEYFFFFIQTYITSCLYALLSRPVVHSVYLQRKARRKVQIGVGLAIVSLFLLSNQWFNNNGKATYISLILLWCLPFLLLLWSLAYTHIVALPWTATILPVMLPTLYLWLVDTFALRRGTWVIEKGTKLGIYVWPHLEVEEAIFFFVTNLMIVSGHVAADMAFAVCDTFPERFEERIASIPSLYSILKAVSMPCSAYPLLKLEALQSSLAILQDKSKSFSAASMLFEGRLRIDLLSLYAICRVADDSIDEAKSTEEARNSLDLLSKYFRLATTSTTSPKELAQLLQRFPPLHQPALSLLPSLHLPHKPLQSLLNGFATDLAFPDELPIKTKADLEIYASQVASSVAELSVLLAWQTYKSPRNSKTLEAAREMGLALQYVNIARDVPQDLKMGRMYLPCRTLLDRIEDLTQERLALCDWAEEIGDRCMESIEEMPEEARLGLRAACAVYLEVGTNVRLALMEGRILERASVSKWERLKVLWRVRRIRK